MNLVVGLLRYFSFILVLKLDVWMLIILNNGFKILFKFVEIRGFEVNFIGIEFFFVDIFVFSFII